MGAHDIQITLVGATAESAYAAACDEARREYGENAYNGTISTTRGIKVLRAPAGFDYAAPSIRKWCNDEIEKAEKWGPVRALEIPREHWEGLIRRPIAEGNKVFIVVGWAAE